MLAERKETHTLKDILAADNDLNWNMETIVHV